jgi:hypothetical protein
MKKLINIISDYMKKNTLVQTENLLPVEYYRTTGGKNIFL